MKATVAEISVPEYTIESKPDYMRIGRKVDRLIGSTFGDGRYVMRAIGSSDHADKTPDQLTNIILELGTDKYDSDRPEVAYKDFRGYDHDFHGGYFEIQGEDVVSSGEQVYPSVFGDIVYHFYEHAPIDRGYPVRIDILLVYHADHLERAVLVDRTTPRQRSSLETHLYKFKNKDKRREALAGIVRILP